METSRIKTVMKFVLPTILSQCAFFLFTIVDGIFVGRGVGTDALGAVNLALPFTMILGGIFMLTTIGGITITAIRLGRGDNEGANNAFMHFMVATFTALFSLAGIFFTDSIASLLGANDTYLSMVKDYIFWYSVFTIPSGLTAALRGFGRNDNAPAW